MINQNKNINIKIDIERKFIDVFLLFFIYSIIIIYIRIDMEFSPSSNYYGIYDKLNNTLAGGELVRNVTPFSILLFLLLLVVIVFIFNFFIGLVSGSPSSQTSYDTGGVIGAIGTSIGFTDSTPKSNDWSPFITLIKILMIAIIIGLVTIGGLKYLFTIDISAEIKNLFKVEKDADGNIDVDGPNVSIDVKQTTKQPAEYKQRSLRKKEVFHIPGNKYTFDEARALCSAHGAELASYEQIEKAYNDGAEWCSYGWSAGQMALFPTQQATFDKLQKIEGHQM